MKRRPYAVLICTLTAMAFAWAVGTRMGSPGAAGPGSGGGPAGGPAGGDGLSVVVSVPPLRGLVEPMLPAGSRVTVLVPAGMSPHTAEPTPAMVAEVVRADLVVTVGMNLEPGVDRFLSRHAPEGVGRLVFADAVGVEPHDHVEGHVEGHGAGHVHADGSMCFGADAHLWLDAGLCDAFVGPMAGAVEEAMRARGMWSMDAMAALERRAGEARLMVARADAEAADVLAPWRGQSIVTHHDAYSRYVARFGMSVAAVVRPIEAAEPTPGQIADAVRAVEHSGAGAIFVEPQYPSSSATRVAEVTGAALGTLDPVGDGDWSATYVGLARSIAETLEVAPGAVGSGG